MSRDITEVDVLGRYSNRKDRARVLGRLGGLPMVERSEPVLWRRQCLVDAEEVNALVEAYEAGASTYLLGRQLGLHRQRVSALLLARGVVTRYRVVTDEMAAEMLAMRDSGWSQTAIATHFGVARSTVGRVLAGL